MCKRRVEIFICMLGEGRSVAGVVIQNIVRALTSNSA